MYLATIMVKRLRDTITCKSQTTRPQAVSLVDHLCDEVSPFSITSSPCCTKSTARARSTVWSAARLDLPEDRMYSGIQGGRSGKRMHVMRNGCTHINQGTAQQMVSL